MNIHSLWSNSTTGLTGSAAASSQASNAVNTGSPMLTKVDKRIQADVDSTTAQLSKFGLLKSAISDSQTAAHALSGLSSATSSVNVTSAMGRLFNAFNSVVSAAKTASAVPGSTSASQSANKVTNDFKRALISDSATREAVKKLGLTVQADGTLTQDAKKFAAALASNPSQTLTALATIGKQIDAAATKELATNGRVDAEISSLNKHGAALAAQQKALRGLNTSSTTQSATPTSSSSQTRAGLAAYHTNSMGI